MNSATEESRQLQALANAPLIRRVPAYLRLSGPGWLQGAMTLGGGSAITSLTACAPGATVAALFSVPGATLNCVSIWMSPERRRRQC